MARNFYEKLGTEMPAYRSAGRLSQECFKHVLIDVGGGADFHMPYVLAITFEKHYWVL